MLSIDRCPRAPHIFHATLYPRKKMKQTVMLVCASLANAASGQFSWEEKADLPVSGLYGPTTFVIGAYGYVVSGNSAGTDLQDVWMYDMESDIWVAKAPIPQARRAGAGFSINGKGYVACGTVGGSTKLNDLWEYDPVADTWASRADFPGDERYGTCYFALGGLGYVGTGNIGTSAGPYASDMYAYDPITDSWSQKASMPGLSRYGTSTITASGHAFVFGGLMSDQEHTGDIYEYDPVGDVWELREPLPGSTRTYAMALSYTNDGAIVAGKSGANVNIYDGFFYVPNLGIWTPIPVYPGASGWVGATMAINGRSFGGLGYTLTDQQTHNDWWELVKVDDNAIIELGHTRTDQLHISPNPIAPGTWFRFVTDGQDSPGEVFLVSICSMQGDVVYSTRSGHGSPFSCPRLKDGAYVMRLTGTDGWRGVGRFIVATEH
jgi:hypothetical protein